MQKFNSPEEVWERLRKFSIKKTWIRIKIIELFFKRKYITLKEIIVYIRLFNQNVSYATIYNTLNLLKKHYILICYSFEGDELLYSLDTWVSMNVIYENDVHCSNNNFEEINVSSDDKLSLINLIWALAKKGIKKKYNKLLHIKIEVHIKDEESIGTKQSKGVKKRN